MVQYIDRKTGALCTEKVYGEKFLELLYGDTWVARFFSYTLLPLLARLPFCSQLYGWWQKREKSRAKIRPFIETYQVDESEFATTQFESFNDFFIRKLKPSCRPIVSGADQLALPADGRYLAYPAFEHFRVKHKQFDLGSFLRDPALARRFEGASLLVARLCPVDYHRFHFPCDGIPSAPRLINGFLYSVNPIAWGKQIAVFSENKRMMTLLETENFGSILYAEIGATAVGTIRQTFQPGRPVKKGEEKGYFEFGGSCLVLLFEKGKVVFASDLVENARQGRETLCHYGELLGGVRR